MSHPIPELVFTTADVAPDDRLAYWAACAAEYEIRQLPGGRPQDFHATTQAWLLSDLILSHGDVSAGTFVRSPERLRADGVDACNLTLLTRGSWSATFAGRPVTIGAGQFASLDCTQPSAAEVSDDNRYINLSVARSALLSSVPRLPDFHGRVLDGPAGYLLADHLIALTRFLPGLAADQIPLVRQATLLLIAAAFKDLPNVRLEEGVGGLRHDARRYIERHLSEPHLTPDRIRQDLDVRRTALYEAFAPLGGVRAYVQRRRLEVVRALLMLPVERRTIGELAGSFGFASPSHFTKAFRVAFGQSPTAVREGLGLLALDAPGRRTQAVERLPPPKRYARWMDELVAR